MNNTSLPKPSEYQPPRTPLPPYLFEERHDAPFLIWWYRLSLPSFPEMLAPSQERERFRQSRIASQLLLMTLLLIVLALPVSFFDSNLLLFPVFATLLAVLLLAMILNRLGKPTVSGAVVVIVLELAIMGITLVTSEGVGGLPFPLFDALVFPVVIATSLLPIWWSLGIALLNCLFVMLTFAWAFYTRNPGFHPTSLSIFVVPLLLQGLLFAVVLLWRHQTEVALAKADRAEGIARLEHDLAHQGRIIAEQKQQLEEGIQHLINTHLRVAQGDLTARVSLDETHQLWQLAGLLNTLLTRYQQARQAEDDLQRTRIAVDYLLQAVRDAKQHLHGIAYKPTRTMIDVLGVELQRSSATSKIENSSQHS